METPLSPVSPVRRHTVYLPPHNHPASSANGKARSMRPPVRSKGTRTRRRTSGQSNGAPEKVSASASTWVTQPSASR